MEVMTFFGKDSHRYFQQNTGFTLIELIVVISIIGTLLVFSFPLFSGSNLFSDSKSDVGDVVRLIDDLKKRAVDRNIDFKLHIDKSSNKLWVTNDSMDEEANQNAEKKSVYFSKNISIVDIEFPGFQKRDESEYQIQFSRLGYSDFALIHLTNGEKNITLKIEPFLSKVQLLDRHIYFYDGI